jgi:hypothetical protein
MITTPPIGGGRYAIAAVSLLVCHQSDRCQSQHPPCCRLRCHSHDLKDVDDEERGEDHEVSPALDELVGEAGHHARLAPVRRAACIATIKPTCTPPSQPRSCGAPEADTLSAAADIEPERPVLRTIRLRAFRAADESLGRTLTSGDALVAAVAHPVLPVARGRRDPICGRGRVVSMIYSTSMSLSVASSS